jgi:signal transduction histidine kinase
MHDGVGGQLLSLLTRVRMRKVDLEDVEEEIQRGIADLRLVADSLDNVGNDLDSALATFHARAKQQLDAADIAFRWQKPEHFSGAILDPRQILNLYRFLQEALSNAVRHSGARNFSIEFFLSESATGRGVIVTDDGKGFDHSAVKHGHGLSSMKKRAAKLNGTLSIKHGARGVGTVLTLIMPDIGGAPTVPASHSGPPQK